MLTNQFKMKKIRKITYILLVWSLMMNCLAACGNKEKQTSVTSESTTKETSSVQTEKQSNEADSAKNNEDNAMENKNSETVANIQNSGKVLVAYFSATGTTKKLAEYAAEVTGADLYEIVPEEPYTDADLNWNDKNSRTSIEMNDASIKPAINGSVADMGQYDIVFIGYPIWWGDAPHIIDTFMESYVFSGKTIIPFCTSGSSGIGSSAKELHDYTDASVTWLDGDRLKSSLSKEDMADWIKGLSLGIEVK